MQRTRFWQFMLLVCAFISTPLAYAAQGSANAPFRYYTVRDGLTQSEVSSIGQDRAGYLWFTTARGLNRFDGKDFDHYTIADGLPGNALSAIHVSETDTIWVGDTRGHISALRAGPVAQTLKTPQLENLPILDINTVGPRILVVTDGLGVVAIDADSGQSKVKVLGGADAGITNLLVYGTEIWAESATGLYSVIFGADARLELRAANLRHISIDGSGAIWAVDHDNNVGHFANDIFTVIASAVTEQEVLSIDTDRDGIVWLATGTALYRIDSQDPAAPTVYRGVDQVRSTFVDNENSLWLASGSGLIRFLGERFYPLPPANWRGVAHGLVNRGRSPGTILVRHANPIVVAGNG